MPHTATKLALFANLALLVGCEAVSICAPPPPRPADCVTFLAGADATHVALDISGCRFLDDTVEVTQQRTGVVVEITTDRDGQPASLPELEVGSGDTFKLKYGGPGCVQFTCARFVMLGPAAECSTP